MLTRQIAAWKKEIYSDLVELLQKYPVVAVADLRKVRSSQIQEIRKKLRGKAELIIFLNKNKVRVPAKGGDIATSEIMVQAGNTGLQPGPVISEFNEAKVQTRIEGGSIFIAKDTIVASKGDVISTKTASLLSKLGMKPMEAGLSLAYAYDHGLVLLPNDLTFDLDQMKTEFSTAARLAFGVAIEANIMLQETAPQIISKAYRQAVAVSLEAGFLTKETTPLIIQRAVRTMNALSSAISSMKPGNPPAEGKG